MATAAIALLWVAENVMAQQAPDLEFKPAIAKPAYEVGKGPRVGVDGARHNDGEGESTATAQCGALA